MEVTLPYQAYLEPRIDPNPHAPQGSNIHFLKLNAACF